MPAANGPLAFVGAGAAVAIAAGALAASCRPIAARDPFADAPAGAERKAYGTLESLEIGDRVPGFRLHDQEGAPFTLTAPAGGATVVTFFESRSPEPRLCRELLRRLAVLESILHPELEAQLRLVAVTVDPAHDTPEVLRRLRSASALDGTLVYAGGTAEETARLAAAFGVYLWTRDDGSVGHTLNTVVIDGSGRLFDRFPGVASWSTGDLLAAASRAAGR